MKPRALDLFCGAGGATKGLQLSGFHVTGVDLTSQPRYCGESFLQSDALEILKNRKFLNQFHLIWASPPCQGYSRMSGCRDGLRQSYPTLIPKVRLLLSGKIYVIENVIGAPLEEPILLCGSMFGARTYRHRLFESSVKLAEPKHPEHLVPTSKAGHWKPGTFVSVAGHCAPMDECREVMDINWMNREELAEAIPPYFSSFIGKQIIRNLIKRTRT